MGRPKLMQQGDGKKRKRQKKDKDAPKRPCTAFFFFVKHLRNMGEDKDMKVSEFTKMCGVRWRGFGDKSQEKMKFEELASKDRQRYDMEMCKYKGTNAKDPDKPKRPQTAFLLFVASVRPKLRDEGCGHKDVLTRAGEMWQRLTVTDKEPFQKAADQEKKKYEAAMRKYNETHSAAAKPKKAPMAAVPNNGRNVSDMSSDEDEEDEEDDDEEMESDDE